MSVRSKIVGEEPSGPITIYDVARVAEVSPSTVSRVINRFAAIAPDTRARVEETIAKLHFVPNATARNLIMKRTETVAVVFPDMGGMYYSSVLRGVDSVIAEHNYHLLVYTTKWTASQDRARLPLNRRNSDGLIIAADAVDAALLEHIQDQHVPTVVLNHNGVGLRVPSVTVDNRHGAQLAVEHLVSRGRRCIAFIGGPEGNVDGDERIEGYHAGLAAAGIASNPALLFVANYEMDGGERAIAAWEAAGVSYDAIFAANDEMAIGAIEALGALGRRVPQDVAVVGFDDIGMASHLRPALTTVSYAIDDLGRQAARLLFRQFAGEPAEHTVIPVSLVVRASS